MAVGRYRIITVTEEPGGGAGAESRYIHLSAVAKLHEPQNNPWCLANELICGEIGRFLGLPIPPCAIVSDSGGRTPHLWFASLDFNLTGDPLPPAEADRCLSELPDLSTGLLLFDILIANSDRHQGNFSVDFPAQGQARMSVFDHESALMGRVRSEGANRLEELRDRLGITNSPVTRGNRHCLLDVIREDRYFSRWLDRIQQIPDFYLNDRCQDVIDLGVEPKEREAIYDFLRYRRDNLRTIIQHHREEFRSIQQWSLWP